MLEALNGILFHQLANNPNVAYAILRSHQPFEELGTFTLAKGLAEVRRVQQLKDERDTGKSPGGKTSMDSNQAPEKTGLLRGGEPAEEIFDADVESAAALASDMDRASIRSPPPPHGLGLETDSVPPSPRAGTEDTTSGLDHAARMSEKARGKRRERNTSISDEPIPLRMDPELERIAAAGVGRNGFVPTQEWVCNLSHLSHSSITLSDELESSLLMFHAPIFLDR